MTAVNTGISSKRAGSPAALGLIGRLAAKYGVDKAKFYDSLVKVAFRQPASGDRKNAPAAISEEEMLALLLVCEQYDLNPFLKQIYAFKSKSGAIIPVVGIDGWVAILNHNRDYDGLSVRFSEKTITLKAIERQYDGRNAPTVKEIDVEMPEMCECTIFRKGLTHPITIPEFAGEVFVPSSPVWRQYPKRMLRHKAVIQCARIAFGITGIYDEDEARNIAASAAEAVEAADAVLFPAGAPAVLPAGSDSPQKAMKNVSDKMLESVVKQALKFSDWNVAYQWIEENVPAAQLEHARAFVRSREAAQQQFSTRTEHRRSVHQS